MPFNPFYQLVTTDDPTLTPKTSREDRKFYLLPLARPLPEQQRLIKPFEVKNHHLSIFEEYIKGSVNLSPIHYTGEFLYAGQIIKIHVFFDENGNYHDCRLADNAVLRNLSNIDKMKIQKFAEDSASELLSSLTNKLIKKQNENQATENAMLQTLERYKDVKDDNYKILLAETIRIFNKHSEMNFYPDHSIKNILQDRLDYLNRLGTVLKTKSKKSIASPSKNHSYTSEEEQKQSTVSTAKNKKNKKKNSALSVAQYGESLNQRLLREEHKIYQKLEKCSPNDFDTLINFTQQLHGLGELRANVLIQASIDDDISVIDAHIRNVDFNKNQDLAVAMLGACVYHNHLALFDHIYNTIENKYIKHFLYTTPLIQVMPCKYSDLTATSLLSLAHQRGNLTFFKALLTKYHYTPIVDYFQTDILLQPGDNNNLAPNDPDLEYKKALLEAGADLTAMTHQQVFAASSFNLPEFICETEDKTTGVENNKSNFSMNASSHSSTEQIQTTTEDYFTMFSSLGETASDSESESDKESKDADEVDTEQLYHDALLATNHEQEQAILFDLANSLSKKGEILAAIKAMEKCCLIRQGLLAKANNNPIISIGLKKKVIEAQRRISEIAGLNPDIVVYHYN